MNYWMNLKEICTGKIITATAVWIFIVPAMTKIFNLLESNTTLFETINIIAPYSIIILYFSAMAFFLASITYIVFCPELIKKYNSYTEYATEGKNQINLSNSLKNLNDKSSKILIDKLKNNITRALPADIDAKKSTTIVFGKTPISYTFKNEDITDVFWAVYEYYTGTAVVAQIIIGLFLSVGFALLTFILFSNLFLVIKSL